MTTDENSPLRGEFSRRSLLKGLGVTGLGALLGPALLGMSHADAATPNRAPRRALDKAKPKPAKKLGATSGGLTTPYTLQASTELSEDHFLTDTVQLGTGDELVPFTNPKTQQVEAIVLSGNNVSHLQRDPDAIGGWTLVGLDVGGYDPDDGGWVVAQSVAVAANADDAYLLIYGQPENSDDSPVLVYHLTSATTWDAGTLVGYDGLGLSWTPGTQPPTLGQIKGGINVDGVCYFYTLVTWNDGTRALVAWTATGDGTVDSYLSYQLVLEIDDDTATVNDYVLLLGSLKTDAVPVGYCLVFAGTGLTVYNQDVFTNAGTALFSDPNVNTGTAPVTALLAAWIPASSAAGMPGYVVQTPTETLFIPGDGTDVVTLTDAPIQTTNSVAVWTGEQNVVNFLDTNDTLNTSMELAPPVGDTPAVWSTPISLVAGLASIFTVPTDPSESTLFAIDLDGALSVLTLDATGWTQTTLHTDSATRVQIDSYRTKVAVLDVNGIPAAGAQVQIVSDRPVGIWQADGHSFITPTAAQTFTADSAGEITFSIPADELDCAVLTVNSLDVSTNAATLTVTPDTDVRGFLNGTGTLTDLGAMNGGTALLQAQNSAGGDLFPGLTGLSGSAQQTALAQTTTALTTFLAAGAATAPTGDIPASLKLDLSGGVPSLSRSSSSAAYMPLPKHSGLQFSVSHLFHTIGHAIRHGVAKVTQLIVQWDSQLRQWVINISAEIAGAVQSFENLVITDMKDAFHAIGGFFQALGADIADAINWLKHNVIDLLKAAWTNTGTIATFLATLPASLVAHVQEFKTSGDNFFAGLESDVTTWLGTVEKQVTGMTLTSPAPQPTPSTGTGSASAQSGLLHDVGEFTNVINHSPGKWLWDKISHDMPAVISLGVPTLPSANYEQPLTDLADAWNGAQHLVDDILAFEQNSYQEVFGSTHDSASQASMSAIFDKILSDTDDIILTFLQMCDALFDAILDILVQALNDLYDTITAPFQIVSPTSLLGQLLDLFGVDVTMTLAEISALAVAFPATLVSKIVGNGAVMPAIPAVPAPSDAARLGVSDTNALWLGILGGSTQCVWGLADIIGDLQTLTGEDGTRGEQSAIVDLVDIFAPMLETGLLFPVSQKLEKQLVPPIVFTALLPSLFGLLGLTSWPSVTSALDKLPEGAGDVVEDCFGPVLQSFAGLANTALAIAFQVENGDTVPTDIAGTVLGNLSFMLAVFGTFWLNATTSDVPVLVKTVVDAAGNVGAAVCIYESSTLPPK